MLEALYRTFGWHGLELTFTLKGEVIMLYNAAKAAGHWYALPHSDSLGLIQSAGLNLPDDNPSDGSQSSVPLVPIVPFVPKFQQLINNLLQSEALYSDVTGVERKTIELSDIDEVNSLTKAPAIKHLGIRSLWPMLQYHEPLKVVNIIDLKSYHENQPQSFSERRNKLLQGFSANVRRKINKALKNGIIVKVGGTELLDDFYTVYRQTIHRHGSFGLPKEFYRKLLNEKNPVAGPSARLFVAYLLSERNSAPIAIGAAQVLSQLQFTENNAFATLLNYNHLYTSYALHMAMLEYAIERGSVFYSLGRSTPGSGVHEFKKQFGGKELPLYYCCTQLTKKSAISSISIRSKLSKPVIRLLPKSVVSAFDEAIAKKYF